jgi:hypothetical protein
LRLYWGPGKVTLLEKPNDIVATPTEIHLPSVLAWRIKCGVVVSLGQIVIIGFVNGSAIKHTKKIHSVKNPFCIVMGSTLAVDKRFGSVQTRPVFCAVF